MKKISAKHRKDIQAMLERSIDSVVLSSSFEKNSVMNSLLKNIQERFSLKNFPYNMECVDISHFSGGWTS